MPTPSTNGQQQVIVRMDPSLHQALKSKAAEDDRSMAQAIRHAVKQYVGQTNSGSR